MNRANLKISIITPSYNSAQYLEQTIVSVLDQGYKNLEYIIIDGGSTDDTLEIINRYKKYLAYWVSEEDNGQSEAINKGYARATGDVINWLNSDDYYEPGTLKHVAHVFMDPAINVYCGKSRIFGPGIERTSNGTDVYVGNLAKTIGWARIDQPETFFRKSVIDTIGYLDENLHYVMDKELWIRYLCKYGLQGILKDNEKLVNFRLHEGSKTVSLHEKFEIEASNLFYTYAKYSGASQLAKLMDQILMPAEIKLYNDYSSLPKHEWIRVLNYYIFYVGLKAYASNNFKLAKVILGNIQSSSLAEQDLVTLVKVQKRIKYLPIAFKKFVNKLNS